MKHRKAERMNTKQVLARIDPAEALEFLAGMVRHKSHSGTTGETELARFMAAAMLAKTSSTSPS